MDISGYGRCAVADHIEALRRDGQALAQAAVRSGLDAAVPACPGWRVRDLLKHIGYVHRWAAKYVTEGHTRWVDRSDEGEILRGGPRDPELPGWYRQGHADLVRALENADPGLECWTFLQAPSSLAFWARRQAHETAIHRVDAEQAAGLTSGPGTADRDPGTVTGGQPETAAGERAPFAPGFAADGIDELIMGFLGRNSRSWRGPRGTIAFHADDGHGLAAHWRVDSAPGRLTVSRAGGPADCEVTAPAGEVYLLLWNRRPARGLAVSGDAALLEAFRAEARVTWR